MSLIKFYSKEDIDITGNPQFSFFDRTSPCFNYFRYIEAKKKIKYRDIHIFVLKMSHMKKKIVIFII